MQVTLDMPQHEKGSFAASSRCFEIRLVVAPQHSVYCQAATFDNLQKQLEMDFLGIN